MKDFLITSSVLGFVNSQERYARIDLQCNQSGFRQAHLNFVHVHKGWRDAPDKLAYSTFDILQLGVTRGNSSWGLAQKAAQGAVIRASSFEQWLESLIETLPHGKFDCIYYEGVEHQLMKDTLRRLGWIEHRGGFLFKLKRAICA
jgi:hypothetical protein